MTLEHMQRVRAIELEMALDALLDLDRRRARAWVERNAAGVESLRVFVPGNPEDANALSEAMLARLVMLKPQLIELLRGRAN